MTDTSRAAYEAEKALPTVDEAGVDLSLIRWMRTLTMEKRLRWLQDSANALSMIRDGLTHTRPH